MNTVVPNQVAHAPAPAEKPGKFSGVDFKRWPFQAQCNDNQ